MTPYDIAFLGHMCYDDVVPFNGERTVRPGSAVLCGAMAAVRTGRKIAAIVKMSPADEPILQPMRDAGIDTILIPAPDTSRMEVIHPSADVDDRRMFLRKNASHVTADEVPPIDAAHLHLAGISDQEFSLELICDLVERGYNLSVDMQSFVRQVDPDTGEVSFRNVMLKRPIVSMVRKVKLDVVEAKLLTGEDDLEQAALVFERWGCPEIVITESKGVLARVGGATFYERFTNRSSIGRTGRGDTTFAAYLAWRIDHDPAESLKFAAALVSIKMERPGPFRGTMEEVLMRMNKAEEQKYERRTPNAEQ